jgi:hypothetical protein
MTLGSRGTLSEAPRPFESGPSRDHEPRLPEQDL